MYITADNPKSQTTSVLDKMTMNNAMGYYYRAWVILFFTVIYSMLGHMLLFFFEEKRRQWKINVQNMDPSEMTDVEISMHSLLLRGVNKEMPIVEAEQKIEAVFKELLEDELVKVHVIGDYDRLLYYLQKYRKNQQKMDFLKRNIEEMEFNSQFTANKPKPYCTSSKKTPLEQYQHYDNKRFIIENQMKSE
jgi:hypothetical protein